jgi:hypothetical protein
LFTSTVPLKQVLGHGDDVGIGVAIIPTDVGAGVGVGVGNNGAFSIRCTV